MLPAEREGTEEGAGRGWGEGAAMGCGRGKRARKIFCGVPDVSARPSLPETCPTTAKACFWQALRKSGKEQHSLEIPLENVLGTEKKHVAEKNLLYGRAESSHM